MAKNKKSPSSERNGGAKNEKKLTRREEEALAAKKSKRTKRLVTVVAIVAVLAILGTVLAVFIVERGRNRAVDYLNDDLSRYVYISESDYKNYPVVLELDKVTDLDVENMLMRKLCEHKNKTAEYDGANVRNVTVAPGHVVNMWYRGYTLENGVKNYFDGGCNFSREKPTSQEIGSKTDKLYPGFELGLIGKNPKDYSQLEVKDEGKVGPTDLVLITYTALWADGSYNQNVTELIDPFDPETDKKFGVGFGACFRGEQIGSSLDELTFDVYNDDIQNVYTDVKIERAFTAGKNPLVVEAYAPTGVASEEIAGKTVYFEVYIVNSMVYRAPAANDAFVTDVLKLTDEDLKDFEGETALERYKAMLRDELEDEYESAKVAEIENAMWDYYTEKAEYKRLPEYEVEKYYRQYVVDLEEQYKQNGSSTSYGSFDEFASAYLDLGKNQSWESELRTRAENSVKEKLVFYYIITKEGLVPSEEKYKELYDKSVDDYVFTYMDTIYDDDDFETEEEYDKEVESIREMMLEYYGEEYFRENAYFLYAIDTLVSWADVKE